MVMPVVNDDAHCCDPFRRLTTIKSLRMQPSTNPGRRHIWNPRVSTYIRTMHKITHTKTRGMVFVLGDAVVAYYDPGTRAWPSGCWWQGRPRFRAELHIPCPNRTFLTPYAWYEGYSTICKVLVRPGRESNARPTSTEADALTKIRHTDLHASSLFLHFYIELCRLQSWRRATNWRHVFLFTRMQLLLAKADNAIYTQCCLLHNNNIVLLCIKPTLFSQYLPSQTARKDFFNCQKKNKAKSFFTFASGHFCHQ